MSNTTKEKKDYYFTDVAEYLKADYENKPSKEKAIISGIEEQIKTLLKKMLILNLKETVRDTPS